MTVAVRPLRQIVIIMLFQRSAAKGIGTLDGIYLYKPRCLPTIVSCTPYEIVHGNIFCRRWPGIAGRLERGPGRHDSTSQARLRGGRATVQPWSSLFHEYTVRTEYSVPVWRYCTSCRRRVIIARGWLGEASAECYCTRTGTPYNTAMRRASRDCSSIMEYGVIDQGRGLGPADSGRRKWITLITSMGGLEVTISRTVLGTSVFVSAVAIIDDFYVSCKGNGSSQLLLSVLRTVPRPSGPSAICEAIVQLGYGVHT
jgi:hypothetical protein